MTGGVKEIYRGGGGGGGESLNSPRRTGSNTDRGDWDLDCSLSPIVCGVGVAIH